MLAALLLFAAFVTACGQSGQARQGPGSGSTTATPTPPTCGAYGTFGPGCWPPATFQPYNHLTSPFNAGNALQANVSAHNADIVSSILGPMGSTGHPGNLLALRDGLNGEPTYWIPKSGSAPGVTLRNFTLKCHPNDQPEPTNCAFPDTVSIPAGAVPEDGPGDPNLNPPLPSCTIYQTSWSQPLSAPDCHMIIADQRNDTEYDLYHVSVASIPDQDGTLEVGSAGKLTLNDGSGTVPMQQGNTNAAGFGELAGRVRAEELLAGQVDHALYIGVTCSNGTSVAPDPLAPKAPSEGSCAKRNIPAQNPPALGTWLRLNQGILSDPSVHLQDWEKPLIQAMVTYGMFIGDTTSSGDYFDVETEGGMQYTSMKDASHQPYPDEWLNWAVTNKLGAAQSPYNGYVALFTRSIPWSKYLEVICYPTGSNC